MIPTPESHDPQVSFVELLTTPAKLLCLSSLVIGGLGFWAMFEVLANTGFGFPLLAPAAGGLISCLGAFGLGRVALSLLGLPFFSGAPEAEEHSPHD
tara:strand:+ start:761 stop:1051 length:291 start_codon:yes stop_codon:yes gene_type:complete